MASFPKGTIQIQQYFPFCSEYAVAFQPEGSETALHAELDLVTDGAVIDDGR